MRSLLTGFDQIVFANPEYFYLLLLIPILVVWYLLSRGKIHPTLQVSTTAPFGAPPRWRLLLYHSLFALRLLALTMIILALARPQSSFRRRDTTIEGVEIMLALDISGSMLAEDFKPNRIEAAKEIGIDFIKGRINDRIGLVAFSGESYTQCPLTTDHPVLINLFRQIKSGLITDGTAIGDGLATAVNRLRESQAVSKVIILLTDGVNNMGSVDPLTAAEMAKLYGIRIYTIGIGTIGMAPYPVQTIFGVRYQQVEVKIDEPLLSKIASMTDGKYFRATNNEKLKAIYAEIDALERSKLDVKEYSRKVDEYRWLAFMALALIFAEVGLRFLFFRNIP